MKCKFLFHFIHLFIFDNWRNTYENFHFRNFSDMIFFIQTPTPRRQTACRVCVCLCMCLIQSVYTYMNAFYFYGSKNMITYMIKLPVYNRFYWKSMIKFYRHVNYWIYYLKAKYGTRPLYNAERISVLTATYPWKYIRYVLCLCVFQYDLFSVCLGKMIEVVNCCHPELK